MIDHYTTGLFSQLTNTILPYNIFACLILKNGDTANPYRRHESRHIPYNPFHANKGWLQKRR